MYQRAIVHMDLDSFFVSVECLKDSRLKGIPLAIGGLSQRGVIASCSYEARKFGVQSAMPVKMAKRLCPELVVMRGDMDSYTQYSSLVTDIIACEAPLFEKSSIDEFYLDISGMDRYFGCFQWTCGLREKILKESGLPISFGLSTNKMVSKVGTGEAKPNGTLHIPTGGEKAFLSPCPLPKFPAWGRKPISA
jgi:DNA polymerase IV